MSKRKQKNPKIEDKDKNRLKNDFDDEDIDEDYGIHLSPSGSVLMPSPNPYNMSEKIKRANQQLEEEKKRTALSTRTPKVRFVDPSPPDEDEAGLGQKSTNKATPLEHESKPSKVLLVTLPTAYSIESEEILTDDDYEDDFDLNTDAFRGSRSYQENRLAKFSESEDEVEDSMLPLTEETLSSSLETVVCRSESEESEEYELSQIFSKSISLKTENKLINSSHLDNYEGNNNNNNEPLYKPENSVDVQMVIANLEKYDPLEKFASSEQLTNPPSAFQAYKRQKAPVIKTIKSEFSGPNSVKKRNTAIDPRPSTAPAKRICCKSGVLTKLPVYNGLRSEYGLSKEQLIEREKKKYELSKALRIEKEKKWEEERLKQRENEIKFKNWLIKKKKEAEAKTLRKLQQSNYCFRTTPAPTSHLDKIGVLRRKMLKQENTYLLLDEIFRNAKPQEQKTYRIYLGLCV